jgi:TPR repeat protein
MNASGESDITIHGHAAHAARISQQGQGYQINIDRAFFGFQPTPGSPWMEQFEDFPLVGEADPLDLGVHRAPIGQGSAVPPYVERDVAEEVRDKLARVCRRGGLVMLVGDSTAGKTRLAYEALLKVAPSHRLFRPHGRNEIGDSLVTLISHRQECVLWLDDLEQYIGRDGLTPAMVTHLKRAGVAMVATIRGEQYRRFLQEPTARMHQDGHSVPDFQKIIDQSHSIMVSRLWSSQEIALAERTEDFRVLEAVRHASSFGVSEYLAAGPSLLDEWSVAWGAEANPRGASLIAAAVDCARAGINVSVPRDLLVELRRIYLDRAGGELLRPEGLDQAFSWATRRRFGVASLLIPVNAGSNYRAFDYLVDSLMRKEPGQPIPGPVWSAVLEYARSSRDLLPGVASAARRHSLPEIELNSWIALAEVGDPRGALQVGLFFDMAEDIENAFKWYEKAVEMGDPEGWTAIGLIYERQNDARKSEEYFRRAAEADNAHGMNHLGMLMRRQGNFTESESWYRKALAVAGREPLEINLANLLNETGRLNEAEAFYRKALEKDQAAAALGLASLLARSDRQDEARDLWRKEAARGIEVAAAQLAMAAESDGDLDEAENWWQRTIDLGSSQAILHLAVMLDASSSAKDEHIEGLFQQAIDAKVDDSAYGYGVFLFNRRRYNEAEIWVRREVDEESENEDAPYLLGLILERQGGSREEIELWWERAAKDGHESAQDRLGESLFNRGDYEQARRWLTPRAEAGNVNALCRLGWMDYVLGDRDEAERKLTLSFNAGHAHAACHHGTMLMGYGELESAAERYKAAYQSGHSHVAEELEKIYRKLGRGRDSAEWMRRVKEGPSRPSGRNVKKPKKKRRRSK